MQKYIGNEKVHYLKHERNLNGSAARNTGIKMSKGEFITFLDDDDVLNPVKIQRQVDELNKKSAEYGVVICGVEICDELTQKQINLVIPKAEENAQFDMLKLRLGMGTGSNPMFRREVIEKVGLFDVSFLRHQDTEYMIRVLRHYKLATIQEILITKFESGHKNRPTPQRYLQIQHHFLSAFENDIKQYSAEQQAEIYRNNWHQMCIVAVDGRDWDVALACYRCANKYMKYTMRMKLGIIRHIINNRY